MFVSSARTSGFVALVRQLRSGTWHQDEVRPIGFSSRHPAADPAINLSRAQRGPEQRSNHTGELIWTRDRRMRGVAEHSAQRLHVGSGADRQAYTAGAAVAGFGQGAARVRGAVSALVSVVVCESVGQHHQQPP